MIIGVAGRNGAGKGEVVGVLVARGFVALSLSDAIRNVLQEKGLEESRELMIETGNALRAEGGPGILAEKILERMVPETDYAIDSVRHPAEVEALRASGRAFRLFWVDADPAIRIERIRGRRRPGDPQTLEQLAELEGRERGSANPAAQQLDRVEEDATVRIENERDLPALQARVEAALA